MLYPKVVSIFMVNMYSSYIIYYNGDELTYIHRWIFAKGETNLEKSNYCEVWHSIRSISNTLDTSYYAKALMLEY